MRINKFVLTGCHVVADAILKYTPQGTAILKFRVGWSAKKDDKSEFYNIVVWAKYAEKIAGSITKGRRLNMEGRVHDCSRQQQDGTWYNGWEIVANTIDFVDYVENGDRQQAPQGDEYEDQSAPQEYEDQPEPRGQAAHPGAPPAGGLSDEEVPF